MRACARLAMLLHVVAIALAPIGWSCKGWTGPAHPVEAPRPKPRNAHLVALQIVQGKLGTMVYVDRLRGCPAAEKLARAGYFADLLDGTGLDPMRDFDRVFVASTGITRDDRAVVIAQHKLTADRLRSAVDVLIARSEPPGAWLDGMGLPAARVTIHGHTRVIGMVDDDYVAVVPEPLAGQARLWLGTGGFPDPQSSAAIVSVARDPSTTLRAPRLPRIPQTVSSMRIELRCSEDGSVDASVDADSASEQQAEKDAATMTEEVARATSVRVAIFRVNLFKPVAFRSEGRHVKSDVHLTGEEVDKLVGMAELLRRSMP